MSTFVKQTTIPTASFVAFPPIFCQRNEVLHAKRIKKYVRNSTAPTLLDVALFVYPDGKTVIGNGNTRKHIWVNSDAFKAAVPTHVRASYYSVTDDADAQSLYYTFDSDTAVEKGADKFQGAFRAAGLTLQYDMLAKGAGASGYKAALRGTGVSDTNPVDVVEYLKAELPVLDGLNWVSGASFKGFRPAFFAAAIMLLKKYGTKNKRLIAGLNQLVSNNGGGANSNDPIDKILYTWHLGGDRYVPDTKSNSSGALEKQLDYVLYCFDRYMSNKTIGRVTKLEGTYKTFWENV